MSIHIGQYRYYGYKNKFSHNNFPAIPNNLSYNESNQYPKIFSFEKYNNIKNIKIQTVPGTKIFLNNNNPIIIGRTGILNINPSEYSNNKILKIYGISLDNSSKITLNNLDNGYIIITFIYEEEEKE